MSRVNEAPKPTGFSRGRIMDCDSKFAALKGLVKDLRYAGRGCLCCDYVNMLLILSIAFRDGMFGFSENGMSFMDRIRVSFPRMVVQFSDAFGKNVMRVEAESRHG